MSIMGGEDILPDDEGTFAFTTSFEASGRNVRLLRTARLLAGLVLVGAGLAVLIIVVVRALSILLPKIFPTG